MRRTFAPPPPPPASSNGQRQRAVAAPPPPPPGTVHGVGARGTGSGVTNSTAAWSGGGGTGMRAATPAVGGPFTPLRPDGGVGEGGGARTPLQAVAVELSRMAHPPPSAAKLPGLIDVNPILYDDDIPDDMLAEVDVIAPQQAAPARDMELVDLSPPRQSVPPRDTPYVMDVDRGDGSDGGGAGGGMNVSLLASAPTPATMATARSHAVSLQAAGFHTGPPSAASTAVAAGASPPVPLQQPAKQAAWVVPTARPAHIAGGLTVPGGRASYPPAVPHDAAPPGSGARSGFTDPALLHRAVSAPAGGDGPSRPGSSSGIAAVGGRDRGDLPTTAPGSTAEDVGLRQQVEQLRRELAATSSELQRVRLDSSKVSLAFACLCLTPPHTTAAPPPSVRGRRADNSVYGRAPARSGQLGRKTSCPSGSHGAHAKGSCRSGTSQQGSIGEAWVLARCRHPRLCTALVENRYPPRRTMN